MAIARGTGQHVRPHRRAGHAYQPRGCDAGEHAAGNGVNFVSSSQIENAAHDAGISKSETAAIVDDYETAQLRSLKAGLLGAAFLALISLAFTHDLPHEKPDPRKEPDPAAA